jgi:hypothetical protein
MHWKANMYLCLPENMEIFLYSAYFLMFTIFSVIKAEIADL